MSINLLVTDRPRNHQKSPCCVRKKSVPFTTGLKNSSFKLKWNWFSFCKLQESFRNEYLQLKCFFWSHWYLNWSIVPAMFTVSFGSLRVFIMFCQIRKKAQKPFWVIYLAYWLNNFVSNDVQRSVLSNIRLLLNIFRKSFCHLIRFQKNKKNIFSDF